MNRLGYEQEMEAMEKYAFRLNCSQLHVNIAKDCKSALFRNIYGNDWFENYHVPFAEDAKF